MIWGWKSEFDPEAEVRSGCRLEASWSSGSSTTMVSRKYASRRNVQSIMLAMFRVSRALRRRLVLVLMRKVGYSFSCSDWWRGGSRRVPTA